MASGCFELSMVVYVAEDVIKVDNLPAANVLYSAWTLPGRQRHWEALGDYQYVGPESGPSGYLGFAFSKAKTDTERNTPWRTRTRFGDHGWDDILLGIPVERDRGFLRSTVAAVNGQRTLISGPSLYPRPVIIPGGARGTQFVIREYMSPTKYNIPAHETPVPGLVHYDIAGKEGTIVALHDDLTIQSQRTVESMAVMGGGDLSGVSSGLITGQFFPATNLTTWAAHIIYDDQQFSAGVWQRTQIEALPPALPEPVRQ